MLTRRYEFYVRVAKTISHESAQHTREILFSHKNIKFISLRQRVRLLLYK